jgi:hypothetical protein
MPLSCLGFYLNQWSQFILCLWRSVTETHLAILEQLKGCMNWYTWQDWGTYRVKHAQNQASLLVLFTCLQLLLTKHATWQARRKLRDKKEQSSHLCGILPHLHEGNHEAHKGTSALPFNYQELPCTSWPYPLCQHGPFIGAEIIKFPVLS